MISESNPARCACSRAYHGRSWRGLPQLHVLLGARLGFLTAWPEQSAIEVRRCPCGRELARVVSSRRVDLDAVADDLVPA